MITITASGIQISVRYVVAAVVILSLPISLLEFYTTLMLCALQPRNFSIYFTVNYISHEDKRPLITHFGKLRKLMLLEFWKCLRRVSYPLRWTSVSLSHRLLQSTISKNHFKADQYMKKQRFIRYVVLTTIVCRVSSHVPRKEVFQITVRFCIHLKKTSSLFYLASLHYTLLHFIRGPISICFPSKI